MEYLILIAIGLFIIYLIDILYEIYNNQNKQLNVLKKILKELKKK